MYKNNLFLLISHKLSNSFIFVKKSKGYRLSHINRKQENLLFLKVEVKNNSTNSIYIESLDVMRMKRKMRN